MRYTSQAHLSSGWRIEVVKRIVIGEQPCNKSILAVTTVAFFLVIMIPNYSVLAYTEHGEGDKRTSDTMFFRVLKGDLNVCSPDFKYNITVCQMVMKEEELLPSVGEVTNSKTLLILQIP